MLPNILSAIRIVMIPFIAVYYYKGQLIAAAVLLALSFFTDFLDGFIARRFNMITPLGKILDPVADKLTQLCVAVLLCIKEPILIPAFSVIFIKEISMLVLGAGMIKKGVTPAASKWYGKVTTGMFYVGVIAIVMFDDVLTATWKLVIVCAIVFMALYAAFNYLFIYLEKMKEYKASLAKGEGESEDN